MNTTTHLDAISAFIFIGVFQGLILSFFFIIKSSSNIKANLYQGLLLLSLTLCILEQFLNLHQELIDGCRRGDQKSQFQIYKLYYKAMYNTSVLLKSQKQNHK